MIKRFRFLGFHVTCWWWRKEKRKGALGMSGVGLIIER